MPLIAETKMTRHMIINWQIVAIVITHDQFRMFIGRVTGSIVADETSIPISQLVCHATAGVTRILGFFKGSFIKMLWMIWFSAKGVDHIFGQSVYFAAPI